MPISVNSSNGYRHPKYARVPVGANPPKNGNGFLKNGSDDVRLRAIHCLEEVGFSKTCRKGETLFLEGSAARGLYLLASGRAKVSLCSADGRKVIMRIAGRDSILGLYAALTGRDYEATAEMLETGRVIFVPRRDLLELIARQPWFGRSMVEVFSHHFSELIDLGFFSIIAKVLVAFLLKVHSIIPNWGVAIIILTITARSLLFPLALPGVKGMIKMRELKPEIDALNEKFKDDAQAKGLAQMELWRKHNVNPLKGCAPQLASMPVWFALYTTLQTAVELYHIPFLWFPDLSAADPLYILPFIIGTTSFFQQRLMPQQGDPAQQKMMQYLMPGMMTVFMLFLPAGLGVYMFTNGVLGILQQQAVEWHVRRTVKPGGGSGSGSGDIKVKVIGESASKGKSNQAGSAPSKKLASDGSLLGKGKAES